MATSNTSVSFRMPASYPANQSFPGSTGTVFTDTETQPASSAGVRSMQAFGTNLTRQNLLIKRKIQVQKKTFRTDQDNGAVDFQSCYTTVTEDVL